MTIETPTPYQQQSEYEARMDRWVLANHAIQPGVYGSGDFRVNAAAGALQVTVASGAAWVAGTGTRQGYYLVTSTASDTLTMAAAHDTLPRIDQITVRARDADDLGDSTNQSDLVVVQGTATAGATLDNRTGAATLPSNSLRLADILVPAAYATAFVQNTHIRDRRPWARGAFWRTVRNSNAAAGNDYTTTSTSAVAIDATNLAVRLECTGNPLRMTLSGRVSNSTAGANSRFSPWLDSDMPESDDSDHWFGWNVATGGYQNYVSLATVLLPSAGSHVFSWAWAASSGTQTLFARAGLPVVMTVEEISKQNTGNTGA